MSELPPAEWIKRQSELWQTGEKTVIEWFEKLCANNPQWAVDPKVLVIHLHDVDYGPDLSSYLKENQLDYYVERSSCESPLDFYIIGSFNDQMRAVRYVCTYDDLDMDETFEWVEDAPEENEDYTVHELTGCTLEKFREKVQIFYEQNPLPHF